jgi:hypothetical protein
MPTKTISLRIEAYERLRRARLRANESFSDVVMRAEWPGTAMTAGELREVYASSGAHLTEEELGAIEENTAAQLPTEDKWTGG